LIYAQFHNDDIAILPSADRDAAFAVAANCA